MAWAGRVAVITGATCGIVLATAEALSARGVKLVLHVRRREILEAHAARLPDCAVLAGNVGDPDTAGRLVALALERFGRMDIAFSNAEIGRASLGKECVSTCRSRWSPDH